MDGLCWLRRQNAQTEQPRNAGPFSCDTKTGSAYSSGAHCSFVGGVSFSEDCQLFPEEGATSAPHFCIPLLHPGYQNSTARPWPAILAPETAAPDTLATTDFFSEACVLLHEHKSASELARAEPFTWKTPPATLHLQHRKQAISALQARTADFVAGDCRLRKIDSFLYRTSYTELPIQKMGHFYTAITRTVDKRCPAPRSPKNSRPYYSDSRHAASALPGETAFPCKRVRLVLVLPAKNPGSANPSATTSTPKPVIHAFQPGTTGFAARDCLFQKVAPVPLQKKTLALQPVM